MAASAAATVKINIVNIWPTISPEKIENEIKLNPNGNGKKIGKLSQNCSWR